MTLEPHFPVTLVTEDERLAGPPDGTRVMNEVVLVPLWLAALRQL